MKNYSNTLARFGAEYDARLAARVGIYYDESPVTATTNPETPSMLLLGIPFRLDACVALDVAFPCRPTPSGFTRLRLSSGETASVHAQPSSTPTYCHSACVSLLKPGKIIFAVRFLTETHRNHPYSSRIERGFLNP